MAIYIYIKSKVRSCRPPFWPKLVSAFCFGAGLFLVAQVIFPIVSWYLFVLPSYEGSFVSPLAIPTSVVAPAVAAGGVAVDSYRPATWFAGQEMPTSAQRTILRSYSITIPKLGIDEARVEVGGEDLKKSLIAWPTSASPGSFGVNIIFGHSELPQIASSKDYAGIFTWLMDLEAGDEIFVDYDGVRYKYEVFNKKVVEAEDISVLEQRFDKAYLTLITCVPPGTLWKRGVVTARLTQI